MHKVNYWSHNWLAIKINNKTIADNLFRFKGVVYDLGCGTRPYEQDILAVSDQYIGVDWGSALHTLQADTVTSFQVLEHLHSPQNMLDEAYRILKDDGQIMLTVPFQWWVHEAPYDYFRYTPFGLKFLFEKAGFEDIEVIANSGFFTMWTLKMNYFSVRLIRGPRLLRRILKIIFTFIWFISQKLASTLDKLDKDWALESAGYTVLARKK